MCFKDKNLCLLQAGPVAEGLKFCMLRFGGPGSIHPWPSSLFTLLSFLSCSNHSHGFHLTSALCVQGLPGSLYLEHSSFNMFRLMSSLLKRESFLCFPSCSQNYHPFSAQARNLRVTRGYSLAPQPVGHWVLSIQPVWASLHLL